MYELEKNSLIQRISSNRELDNPNHDQTTKKTTIVECIWILLTNGILSIIGYIGTYLMLSMNIHYLSKSGQLSWIGGAGLGQTWINTIFIYVVACLSLGTVVLSSSAFGAKNYYLVGINYHRSTILNACTIVPSFILVILSYRIFKFFGIQEDVAYQAYVYGIYSMPTIILMTISNATNMFVITHKIYAPILVNQLLITFFHLGSCEFYIVYLQLGVKGASLAFATSIFFGLILVFSYIKLSRNFKETFFWFKRESFEGLLPQLKNETMIGIPYFLEWLSFEIFTFFSMTFGTLQLSAWVILYHMVSIIYMVPLGLGIVISQQVSNSIGEANLHKTKTLIRASIYLTVIVGIMNTGIVYLCRKPFIEIYNGGNEEVYEATLNIVLLYLIMIPADFLQSSVMSVLKAIGKEKIATLIFSVCYYTLGMPLSYFLGSYLELECRGVLIGIITGCYILLLISSVVLSATDVKAQSDEIYTSRTK